MVVGSQSLIEFGWKSNGMSQLCTWGPFINYVMQKGGEGGISQCDDVYIKHTSVWDNV